jgi:hypothetical protein
MPYSRRPSPARSRLRLRCALQLLLVTTVAVAGCESYPEVISSPESCTSGEFEPCNVLTRRCQRRLMRCAAELRGCEPAQLPPVQQMSPQDYVDSLNLERAADPPVDWTHWENALVMLGLVEPGALASEQLVPADVEHLLAVYRSEEDDIILIDRGLPADDARANQLLVHELIHGLQDLDYDLPSFFDAHANSYDSYLAADCVVEGEATYHGYRAAAALLGLDLDSLDWDRRVASDLEGNVQWALEQPSPYLASYWSVPYAFGERLVHTAWTAGGYSEVTRLFAAPPHAMQPLLADALAAAPFPEQQVEPAEPEAPAELILDTRETLGAWGLLLMLTAAGLPYQHGLILAPAWRGDRIWVYEADTATVAVVKLELADEVAAERVEEWLAAGLMASQAVVVREGSRVLAAVANDPSLIGDWATTL